MIDDVCFVPSNCVAFRSFEIPLLLNVGDVAVEVSSEVDHRESMIQVGIAVITMVDCRAPRKKRGIVNDRYRALLMTILCLEFCSLI